MVVMIDHKEFDAWKQSQEEEKELLKLTKSKEGKV